MVLHNRPEDGVGILRRQRLCASEPSSQPSDAAALTLSAASATVPTVSAEPSRVSTDGASAIPTAVARRW